MELLLLELYIKYKNWKYLIGLPIVSLIFINVHASLWWLQFAFILPYLIGALKINKIKCVSKLYVDRYKFKPLFIITIFMLFVGLINPYGIDAVTYLFKSYGIEIINSEVTEMLPLSINNLFGKIVFICSIIMLLMFYIRKDVKLDIRYFLLFCGNLLLVIMHTKCFIGFILVTAVILMIYIKNINIEFKSRIIIAIKNGIKYGLQFFLIITLGLLMYYAFSQYDFKNESDFVKAIEYVADNYDIRNVKLYVEFNDGAYAEWLGLKSYIDGRAELFIKEFNGKKDIFEESILIEKYDDENYEAFINNYKFSHIIIYSNSNFSKYLEKNDKYKVVFSDYVIGDKNNGIAVLVYALN